MQIKIQNNKLCVCTPLLPELYRNDVTEEQNL